MVFRQIDREGHDDSQNEWEVGQLAAESQSSPFSRSYRLELGYLCCDDVCSSSNQEVEFDGPSGHEPSKEIHVRVTERYRK